jgi:hypothetical protein
LFCASAVTTTAISEIAKQHTNRFFIFFSLQRNYGLNVLSRRLNLSTICYRKKRCLNGGGSQAGGETRCASLLMFP